MDKKIYNEFSALLYSELIPAAGCTEPIALALAAAKCRALLGERPISGELEVSSCIIKNVNSVVIPCTGGAKGIRAAICAGIVGGNEKAELEVLSGITPEDYPKIREFSDCFSLETTPADNGYQFYIDLALRGQTGSARIVVKGCHTGVCLLEKNGQTVFDTKDSCENGCCYSESLNLENIFEFVQTVEIKDIEGVISRQVEYNTAISQEGLKNPWGAQVGRTIIERGGDDPVARACAAACAGSDARMSGCELPVVIVSGSGNQGLAASMPVIEYAKMLNSPKDTLYRALCLSALITIYQKKQVGVLSAFCGAVCAGIGSASGISYLYGADKSEIDRVIVNGLAICSGMVCDGAKPSCAAKIYAAVSSAMLGRSLCEHGGFCAGDGVLKCNADQTICAVGRMADEGMKQTNKTILDIMLHQEV